MTEGPSVIDVLQESFELGDVTFERISPEVITIEHIGEWATYDFYVSVGNNGRLLVTTSFLISLPKKRKKKLRQQAVVKICLLLNMIHQAGQTGTFSFGPIPESKKMAIHWEYETHLADDCVLDAQNADDLLNVALEEIDDFYPSFQQVLLPDVTVKRAFHEAIPFVYGHA